MRPIFIFAPTIIIMIDLMATLVAAFCGVPVEPPVFLKLMTNPLFGLYYLMSHPILAAVYLITNR